MTDYPTITAEERRAAWRAFFRKPRSWLGVAVISPLIVFMLIQWDLTDPDGPSVIDVISLISLLAICLYFLVFDLSYRFAVFNDLIKDSFSSRSLILYPLKLIKHPLYPMGWRRVVGAAYIAISFLAVVSGSITCYFIIVNKVL